MIELFIKIKASDLFIKLNRSMSVLYNSVNNYLNWERITFSKFNLFIIPFNQNLSYLIQLDYIRFKLIMNYSIMLIKDCLIITYFINLLRITPSGSIHSIFIKLLNLNRFTKAMLVYTITLLVNVMNIVSDNGNETREQLV